MIGFINTFCYNVSKSQSIIAPSLIYPLHQSLGHAKSSQSSLVVSWQRIYKSLTVTTKHIKFLFSQANSVLLLCILSILILVLPQLSASELDSLISTLHGLHGKHSLYCWQSLFTAPLPNYISPTLPHVCFCGNVFIDPLPKNAHGADHIVNNSCNIFSIVACAYFGRSLKLGLYVTSLHTRCKGRIYIFQYRLHLFNYVLLPWSVWIPPAAFKQHNLVPTVR
jgi:hypothetical protein